MNDEQKSAIQVLRQLLEKLDLQVRELETKRDQLKGSIQQIEENDRQSTPQAQPKSVPPLPRDQSEDFNAVTIPFQKLKGLSQPRAMVAIARHNKGFLRTKDLTRILLNSGLMKPTKNAASICSRLIRESERFERISEGLYRLKTAEMGLEQAEPPQPLLEGAQIVQ